MNIKRRSALIAALLLSVTILFACGATTTIVSGGSGTATSVASHSTATPTSPPLPTPTATPDPSRYNGSWVDNATGTTGAGELIITSSGTTANAQVYGVCGTKCDWGTSSALVGPYSLALAFNLGGGITSTLTMQLSGTDLKVTDANSHFGSSTYFMHRGAALELRAFLYAGAWINDDPHTTGIPEVLVSVLGTTIGVHGYGACTPTYCDWGTRTGTFTGDPYHVLFDFGGGLTDNLSLSLLTSAGTSLQVIDIGSASGTNTYTFHKSLIA